MPSHEHVHIHQRDFLGKPGRFYRLDGKPGSGDDVSAKGAVLFNHALELLDGGRPTLFSVALRLHCTTIKPSGWMAKPSTP